MSHSVQFFAEEISFQIKQKTALRHWISNVIKKEKKNLGALSFVFVSDDRLLEMNKKFLKHDYYTDIITFDYTSDSTISGDIFISIDRVRENAKHLSVSSKDELHRVIIHGVLHLIGYKDKTESDAARMRQKEDYCLSLRDF